MSDRDELWKMPIATRFVRSRRVCCVIVARHHRFFLPAACVSLVDMRFSCMSCEPLELIVIRCVSLVNKSLDFISLYTLFYCDSSSKFIIKHT